MMHKDNYELCELCHKKINTHDKLLVCAFDSKPYHAKCLKIDNDTALELQNLPDWYCPICLENIIPMFNDDHDIPIVNKCHHCTKLISPSPHS